MDTLYQEIDLQYPLVSALQRLCIERGALSPFACVNLVGCSSESLAILRMEYCKLLFPPLYD